MQASCTPTTSRALPGSRMLCRPALRTRRACQPLAAAAGSGAVTLEVKGLTATIAATGQQILNGVNLTIREGEVHAIMGKNGSGKSTLSKVLVGHPDYEVTGGSATFKGKDLFAMDPEERSHAGENPCRMAGGEIVHGHRNPCSGRATRLLEGPASNRWTQAKASACWQG